jgi:beta-lactamase regulating signal transducer with metallopeptidase domain
VNATVLTTSPLWTAAGWTMLHLVWAGAAIGVMAVLMRRLLTSTRPETRYGIALTFLFALSVLPLMMFVWSYRPDAGPRVLLTRSLGASPLSQASVPRPDHAATIPQTPRGVALDWPVIAPALVRLDTLVPYLPWFWLSGSLSTMAMLATGLVGVERLRHSSRLVQSGELLNRCHALAGSLRLARRVSVGICDRLAMPVLIGIVRPLILLPPAALNGWTTEQLEMVLLHELAHLRRWDNVVNLAQRFVESLLFFHPAVWWVSGWVRLERELCCDRLVVEQIGRPIEYAEMLIALSRSRHPGRQAMLAMADRQVMTRIRWLLNLEERSMKLTMPEGIGLLGAVVLGVIMMLGSQAAQTGPADDANKANRSVPPRAVDDKKETQSLDGIPVRERLARNKNKARSAIAIHVQPANPREITLFKRDERRLQIVQLPTTPEGVKTYRCRFGIEIVCNTGKFGTIRMEADEAVIKRGPYTDESSGGPRGETWFEEADLPMEVHLKGNVILRIAGKGEQQTFHAPDVDYDFVTDRLVALDAELEVDAPGLGTPIKISSPRIVQFHPEVRQADGSSVLSERREIRAGHVEPPK